MESLWPFTNFRRPMVESAHYEIRMAGTLPPGALRDFAELSESVHTAHTVLYGPLEDQAALRGLFERLEILGADLLEVRRLQDENQPPEHLPPG
jgi:hypothetical protein